MGITPPRTRPMPIHKTCLVIMFEGARISWTLMLFFMLQDIILVEALKLDDVPPGIYNVHCLPLRLLGAEGSPVRCILMK